MILMNLDVSGAHSLHASSIRTSKQIVTRKILVCAQLFNI